MWLTEERQMCKWDNWTTVRVKIPADLNATGEARWKDKAIDACIADLVQALQGGGIDMRGSCCGHGEEYGDIALQDGRVLIVTDTSYYHHRIAWMLIGLYRAIARRVRSSIRHLIYNRFYFKFNDWVSGKGPA